MGIPFTFHPAEQAKASEVNANFRYIMDLLGNNSTTDRMETTAQLLLGDQANFLISGESDKTTAPTERKHMHFGWNADWNQVGGKWVLTRFVNGEPATVMRLGYYGFDVMTTSTTSGNLTGQLEPCFAVRATTGDDYVYIKNSFHIQNKDDVASKLSDYRLTYVPLDPPATIYNGIALSSQDTTRDVRQYGVSANAKMVKISIEAQAGPSDAYVRFVKQQATVDRSTGFTMHAQANKWNSMIGDVQLGTGANDFMIKIVRVSTFTTAFAYIVGYYV